MDLSLFNDIVAVYSAKTINWHSIGNGLLNVKFALMCPVEKITIYYEFVYKEVYINNL